MSRAQTRGARRGVSVALLCTIGVAARAQGPLAFSERFAVGNSRNGESVLIASDVGYLSPSGAVYVVDSRPSRSRRVIREYDTHGRLVRQFGDSGSAIGQFLSVTSVSFSPVGDSIYLFDPAAHRVTVMTPDGAARRAFSPAVGLNWGQTRMYRHSSGSFVFIGAAVDQRGLVHVTDGDGRHLRSFGELLEAGGAFAPTDLVRGQLMQGRVVELRGGDILVALEAPFVAARFSIDGRQRWLVRDGVAPNPLGRWIVQTDTTYAVGPYPRMSALGRLGDSNFLVIVTDIERERRVAQIRRASDGRLIATEPMPFSSHVNETLPLAGRSTALIYTHVPAIRFIVADVAMRSR